MPASIAGDAWRAVFRLFLLLRRGLELFGRELLAIDGTPSGGPTTRTATTPAARCASSSAQPTNG